MTDESQSFLGTGFEGSGIFSATQGALEDGASTPSGNPLSLNFFNDVESESTGFLKRFLELASMANVSDIHFSELEAAPVCRVARTCVRPPKEFRFPDLRDTFEITVHQELVELCSAYKDEADPYKSRLKVSFRLGNHMVRVACYMAEKRRVAALRLQPVRARPMETLGFSAPLLSVLSDPTPGLVLISGGTSCGKSSTLASLVQFYVSETDHHIRTLEDPFEYEYQAGAGYLTRQRVSPFGDVPSYAEAVEGSLSHDVNVLVFGELRDDASVKQAVFASGLNMLVLATIHAQDVSGTIARVLSAYAPADRPEALRTLESSLKGVVSQKIRLEREKPVLVHESAVFKPLSKGPNPPSFSKYFEEKGYGDISKDASKHEMAQWGWSAY